MESLRQALRQLGFVEGQNVEIQLRYAERGLQQLPKLAAELVGMKVDVILAFGDLGPRIAQQATETIPIVAISDDILGAGLISSLSRPGGNITGFTILSPELSAKRLQVLQEIVPGVSRVAALWDPTAGISQVSMTRSAARSLNLKLQIVEVQSRNEMVEAFRAARNEGAEALNVFIFAIPFVALPGDHRSVGRAQASGDLSVERARGGRRTHLLWARSCGDVAAVRRDRGQSSQGCQAR
jgi:putative ABC transport system substrate-binding protein